MTVRVMPGRARGVVRAPASKSVAHRYLIAAALASGESRLTGLTLSDDLLATCDGLRALGCGIRFEGTTAVVSGGADLRPRGELPCRECGTTLRLLLPLCLVSGEAATLTGSEKLLSRPLGVYENLARERGFRFERGPCRVTVAGRLTPGTYRVPGDISSQFVSGLCYALACLDGESTVSLTGAVESRSYIDLTLDALRAFGADGGWADDRTIRIAGGRTFRAGAHAVEGDESNAAFPLALAALGDPVEVSGRNPATRQGDRVAAAYFRQLRAGAATLSVADCPDLAPILFTVAALSHGGVFTDTARLRLKESDRIATTLALIEALGGTAENVQMSQCDGVKAAGVDGDLHRVSSFPLR